MPIYSQHGFFSLLGASPSREAISAAKLHNFSNYSAPHGMSSYLTVVQQQV